MQKQNLELPLEYKALEHRVNNKSCQRQKNKILKQQILIISKSIKKLIINPIPQLLHSEK